MYFDLVNDMPLYPDKLCVMLHMYPFLCTFDGLVGCMHARVPNCPQQSYIDAMLFIAHQKLIMWHTTQDNNYYNPFVIKHFIP